jgi:hypothetical protein
MTDQIRSADLLVTKALADPGIIQGLKTNTEQTLKDLGNEVVQQWERQEIEGRAKITNIVPRMCQAQIGCARNAENPRVGGSIPPLATILTIVRSQDFGDTPAEVFLARSRS